MKTTLTILSNIYYLDIVSAYVDAISKKLDYDDKARYAIQLAVEEALNNILTYSFKKEEDQSIEIICEIVSNYLKIRLTDKGMPYELSQISAYDPADPFQDGADVGLSTFLMKHYMDRVNFVNLGKNGKELQLIKYLPDKDITQYTDLQKNRVLIKNNKEVNEIKEIRLMKPDEAIDISQSVYLSYGYSYVYEDIYYPERVRASNADGSMFSVVVITEAKNIVGHIGLFKPYDDAQIAEWGIAVVKPEYRGRGIMHKLLSFVIELAQDKKFTGIFAHAVTTHNFTQKACAKFGFSDIALMLGYAPASLKFRKIKDELLQRETTIISYKYLTMPEKIIIYPPTHHSDMIDELYKNLGVTAVCGNSYKSKSSMEDKTVIQAWLQSSINAGFITVNLYGKDFMEMLEINIKKLCLEHVDVIYLYLNLSDPLTALMCEDIEKKGYFFAGIFPGNPFDNTLVLQFLNNMTIDYDAILAISKTSRNLLSYIKGLDPNFF
ncbi:serine/threonine-protein kinase RsbW [Candidatus Magnetomoraceae bacterium gMMP-13]